MAMKEADNEHPLHLDQIDEPVGTEDELTEPGKLRVGDLMAPIGKLSKRLGGINGELGQIGRVRRGVLADKLDGPFQVLNSGVRPNYFASHLARRFFTASWLWTLPAAAACMLRSTF